MSASGSPEIAVFAHADCGDIDVSWLEANIRQALPLCLGSKGTENPLLADLDEVEISLVSDEAIADVHGQFMNDPTATDVITFHHGEILVSIDTARREGPEHGHTTGEELLLYVVHGLLHLNGHIDSSEVERTEMHRIQDEIVEQVLS